jgi:uncharacterized protein YkwD
MRILLILMFTMLIHKESVCQVEPYLAAILKYNESSDFEDEKYHDFDWQSFQKLDIVNDLVDPMNYDSDLMNAAMFFALNKYRQSKGLKTLDYEPRLRDASMIHTHQMVVRNFLDHTNPYDRKVRFPNERMELCGYKGEHIAENVARIFINMRDLPTYWQLAEKNIKILAQSRDHNKHMIDSKYTQLGCGLLFENKNTDGIIYFRTTHCFGKSW